MSDLDQPTIRRRADVSADEVAIVRFLLNENNTPGDIKRGLQRLCELVELGLVFPERDNPRQLLTPLMWKESETLVRRWAYKAIAYIGRSSNLEQLVARLEREPDLENQTWAMAAIISISRGLAVDEICRRAKVSVQPALIMASHLFSSDDPSRPNIPPVNINNANVLELKWSALLDGYGAAPPDLFGGGHPNRSQITDLTAHDVGEVSEYSVWALWKNPAYAVSDLGFSWDELHKRPANVRRWANRLLSKSPSLSVESRDRIVSLSRDGDPGAREGLALGLRNVYFPGFEKDILAWHDVEDNPDVATALLDHMARHSDGVIDYADTVERVFIAHLPGSKVRSRLLAEAAGTRLRQRLQVIELRDDVAGRVADMLPMDDQSSRQGIKIVMGNSYDTGGGDFNAGIFIGGDNKGVVLGGSFWNSANRAVDGIPAHREDEKKYLADVIRVVSASNAPADEAKQVAQAVEQVAADPTSQNKGGLLKALQTLATGSAAAAGTAESVTKLIEIGSNLFS